MKQKIFLTSSVAAIALLQAAKASLLDGQQEEGARELRVTLSTASGRACRANCLNKGHFFCVTDDFQDGVCCDSTASNCRQSETSICSFDLARSWYTQSQYFVCPFEESVCGPSHTVELNAAGTEAEITNLGQEKSANFIFGEVCSYQVNWPAGSVEKD